jgi:hypothetical protein
MDISQQQQTINNCPSFLKKITAKKEHRGPRKNNPLTKQTRI